MKNNQQETSTNAVKNPRKKRAFFRLIFWLFLLVIIAVGAELLLNNSGLFNNDDLVTEEELMDFDDAKSGDSKIDNSKITDQQIITPQRNPRLKAASIDKHQEEIAELQLQFQNLKDDLEKIKNQDHLPKIIISFVKLRDLIKAGKDYQNQLQEFELLINADSTLANKVKKLRITLKNKPKTDQQIRDNFANLIPELIKKESDLKTEDKLLAKVKNNIAKLIVIRRVDGVVKNEDDTIDAIIVKTQNLINIGNYQAAFDSLSSLPKDYKSLTIKMIIDLKTAAELSETNREIFTYLNQLANNV
ncbi:MAG: hypothetical protein O3B09_01940 [Proteobacteria bacterium]|nr:hypothetical protein [Pseudomonadota bacterium]